MRFSTNGNSSRKAFKKRYYMIFSFNPLSWRGVKGKVVASEKSFLANDRIISYNVTERVR